MPTTFTAGTVNNNLAALTAGDTVIVNVGAVLMSTTTNAALELWGVGVENYTVTVNGALIGFNTTLDLSVGLYFSGSGGGTHNLTVGATGSIYSGTSSAIWLSTGNLLSEFTNNGTVTSDDDRLSTITVESAGDSTWTNNGLIHSTLKTAVEWRADGTHTLINTGIITTLDANSFAIYSGNSGAVELIENTGAINGNVKLGDGADEFATIGGVVNGDVDLGAGDDEFYGSNSLSVGDVVDGGDNGDTLAGFAGDDQLNGNAGDDLILGGEGNDTLAGGDGDESIGDSVDYQLASSGVTVSLAIVVQQDTLGDGLDTISGFENIQGSEFGDNLKGSTGLNTLIGLGGNDTIYGGNDLTLDVLSGDFGNDTFIVRTGDQIDEIVGEGTADKVRAQKTFALEADDHIEIMETDSPTGTTAIDLTGNDLLGQKITGNAGVNVLTGLGGEDTINGGKGNDFLSGGVGADKFVFDSVLSGSTNVDKISTVSSLDKIVLDNDIFKELGAEFTSSEFKAINSGTSSSTVNSSDNIIYFKSNGKLYYDPDGSGSAAKVLFADLADGTALVFTQFQMIE